MNKFNETQMQMLNSIGRMMIEDGVTPEMFNADLVKAYIAAFIKQQENVMHKYFTNREHFQNMILDAICI